MNTMQQESEQKAFDWAVRHGILLADEPTASASRAELAWDIYRGLDFFFGAIVALLESEGAEKEGQSDLADSADAK